MNPNQTLRLNEQITFVAAENYDDKEEMRAADAPRRFRIEAYTGGTIRQSWSKEPVAVDLNGMKFRQRIPIVMGHDYQLGSILGQTTSVSSEDGRLIVEGEIMASSDSAKQVIQLADRGYQWQASIGADATRSERIKAGESRMVNGREVTGPARIVKASSLREVSFVTLGADADTSVAIAADAAEESPMADHANDQPVEEPTKVAAATEATASAVEPLTIDAIAAAIASAVEPMKAEISEIKAERVKAEQAARDVAETRESRAPAIHAHEAPQLDAQVIEASWALQGGLPDVESKYDAKTLEAAHRVQRHTSLGEVMLQAAEQGGYDGPRRITSSTLRPVLQAAFAVHSISGILSETVNKFLLAGFDSVESAWRQISAVRSVNDFKTVTSYRLNGGFKFEAMANGGEFKNAGASEESRTISADTYGIMTSVTRQDLINDDLGALTAVPQRIGRGGALKLNDVFWAEFNSDSSFFTVARGNKKTSAGALSIANLKTIATLFRKLTDPDGNPVAIDPRILLVPADLELTAAEIMGSTLIQSGATNGQPERNVLAGRYQVVGSTYLTSIEDYFLCASPADLPVMEVAFLNGVQSPVVETTEADFNTLGVKMRGYFDFGVAKAEYLAAVKADAS